jgi:hypothetical protein
VISFICLTNFLLLPRRGDFPASTKLHASLSPAPARAQLMFFYAANGVKLNNFSVFYGYVNESAQLNSSLPSKWISSCIKTSTLHGQARAATDVTSQHLCSWSRWIRFFFLFSSFAQEMVEKNSPLDDSPALFSGQTKLQRADAILHIVQAQQDRHKQKSRNSLALYSN